MHGGLAEAVRPALAELSPSLQELAHCDYVLGADPIFIGLHAYEDCGDGRTRRQTAHACWPHPFHLRKGEPPTVVLPSSREDIAAGSVSRAQITLEHEHFHIIDWAVFSRTGKWVADWVDLPVVSDYAARDKQERFACAGQRYIFPERTDWGQVLSRDTRRFFDAFSEQGLAVFG